MYHGSAASTLRVLLGVAIAGALACSPATDDDYLSSELRTRVEELKRELSREAATAETLAERTDVLWDWANAYSFTGGTVPFLLPRIVARVQLGIAVDQAPPDTRLAAVDRYVREMQVKDEMPDALGSLRLVPADPVRAASWITLQQTYTVGAMPMQPGGGIQVAWQMGTDQGALQNEDPAADNYLSVRTSNPAARLEPYQYQPRGFEGGPRIVAAYRLKGPALEPGDTLTVTYGDRSGGSRGFRAQSWSTDRLLLPLHFDLEGEANFFSPEWPALRVIGVGLDSVALFAPSVVGVGERFELLVRSQDVYLNRATSDLPEYEILLGDEVVRTIPAGGEAAAVLEGLEFREPGVHRFAVRATDGSVSATSNPIRVREEPAARTYWGDTHSHSGHDHGQGSAEEVLGYATEDARLDFVVHSEHDSSLDDSEWHTLQELARRHTEEGRLVAFLGYEWTVPKEHGGHHNVFFRTADRDRVARQDSPTLPDLYRDLRRSNDPEDVLVIPHAHEPADWTQNDPDLEKLVEIYSMHGSFEWFGNMYLKNGFEVGFIGASDDHRSKPGYGAAHPGRLRQVPGLAAVMAPEKTPDALFDALRGLSAYATSGERILLDARLNDHGMGSRLGLDEISTQRRLDVRVNGTAAIDRIDVVKNGGVVFSRDYLSAPLTSNSWIQVGFESSSEAFTVRPSRPRSGRPWKGTLAVRGARIRSVSAPGFENRYDESASVSDADGSVIDFRVETRGRMDTLLIELRGATASTIFDVHLDPARQFEAADFSLRLADLEAGRLEHEFHVGRHTDRVSLQVVDPDAPLDQVLELRDLDPPAAGDYYYVRVSQIDGGRAWSSPWWIDAPSE